MTDTSGALTGGPAEAPAIRILAQYIRDLSFENPRAPESLRPTGIQPAIDINVELSARARPDELCEVDVRTTVSAKIEGDAVFQVELLYGGLFQITGVPPEAMEPILLIDCPRLMFPYMRKVISELTTEGGFPPFMIDPIDFGAIYASRQQQQAVGQA